MAAEGRPGSSRFLLLYALANAGGVVAYLPLLTLLLPLKVAAIAGPDRLDVLTATTIAGAIAASLSNIAFGWASDRTRSAGGTRRGWIAGGVAATILSYLAILAATTPAAIVAAVVFFQVALNALLAPLTALLADEVPDARKGLAGGLLVLANPLASLVSALLVAAAALGEGARYLLVCLAVAALVSPVLIRRGPDAGEPDSAPAVRARRRIDLGLAWVARLLVQVAGNVLFIYLLYYFASVAEGAGPAAIAPRVGNILVFAYALPLPIAIMAGRWSDRSGRRVSYLVAAAALAAGGLVAMALTRDWTVAVAGFGCYACGSAIFLALHNVFAMQMLPSADHRGRDLGLLNLTNTLPALIGPALTWGMATATDFRPALLLLAALTLAGGLLMLGVRQAGAV